MGELSPRSIFESNTSPSDGDQNTSTRQRAPWMLHKTTMSQPLPPEPQADESVYFRIHRNVPLIPVSRRRLEHASPVLKQEFRDCVRQGPNLGQNYDDMPMAIQIFLVWLYTGRLPVIADFEIFTSIDLNARAFRTYQLALVTAWKFGVSVI